MNREVVERVRRAIYDRFASQGHPPSGQQVRDLAAVDEAQVNEAVAELAAQRHRALDQSGNVVMAHPFTTVNLGFPLWARGTCGGAGAPGQLRDPQPSEDEPSVLVATTCPACRRPQAWTVTRAGPPEGPEVAHFLVPMDKVWNDVVYACSNQRLFCSKDCVQDWLASTGYAHGYIMDLATLWRLASGWYSGCARQPLSAQGPPGRRRLLPWCRPAGSLLGAQRLTSCSVAAPLGLRHERICGPPPPTAALSAAELVRKLLAADDELKGQRDRIAQSP